MKNNLRHRTNGLKFNKQLPMKDKLEVHSILFFIFMIPSLCFSQNDRTIANRSWDVCTSTTKAIDSSCYYFVTYTFNENGSYNDSRQYTLGNLTANYRGTWQLVNNKLILTTASENGITRSTRKEKITWIDNSTFYTVGREGPLGTKIYTFYKASS